jgi:hypothetical protein
MNNEMKKQLAFTISQFTGINHRRKCKVLAFAISQNEGFKRYVLETKFKKA